MHAFVKMKTVFNKLLVVALALFPLRWARAGNNGYFVTYNSDVERGEVEVMLMNDITSPSPVRRADGQGDYLSHMLELEYGVTSQLATEFMIEGFVDLESGKSRFGGFRWETRYRLFRERVPLNPMLYAEYEDLDPSARFKMEISGWVLPPYRVGGTGERSRERIVETRLVLSDRVGPVDLAFNAVLETEISTGTIAFGYAMGAMWMPGHGSGSCAVRPPAEHPHDATPGCACRMSMPGCHCGHCSGSGDSCGCAHAGMVGVGIEMFGGLGDSIVFGLRPGRQEHYLGPILMYHVTPRFMFHSQLAIGLSETSDQIARVNLGYEL